LGERTKTWTERKAWYLAHNAAGADAASVAAESYAAGAEAPSGAAESWPRDAGAVALVSVLFACGISVSVLSACGTSVVEESCLGDYCPQVAVPGDDAGRTWGQDGDLADLGGTQAGDAGGDGKAGDGGPNGNCSGVPGAPGKPGCPDTMQGDDNDWTAAPQGLLTPEELSEEDMARIAVLRQAISQGLVIAGARYVEDVALQLQTLGLAPDYLGPTAEKGEWLEQALETCPFAQYYDNGFAPMGHTCDYLADLAKVETYSGLSSLLEANPLPEAIRNSPIFSEAMFWYEQGAVSGIEEQRGLVRYDLKKMGVCGAKPTPVESSFDKGLLVGRQLFAAEFNKWLAANGLVPDYPMMTTPLTVCNTDQALLEPARKAAVGQVETKSQEIQLCQAEYQPPTQEAAQQYEQAKIDYRKGINDGVDTEFALAAATVFEVVPCNVSDPLALDLEGDGVNVLPVHRGPDFDLWATGRKQAVAWLGPEDAWLVLDLNRNHVVDNGSELLGNVDGHSADGLAALAKLDLPDRGGNSDGLVSGPDREFALLFAWQDSDSDALTDPGELRTLASLGITGFDPVAHQTLGTFFPLFDLLLGTAPYPRHQAPR